MASRNSSGDPGGGTAGGQFGPEGSKEMAEGTEKKEKATEGHSDKTTKTDKETDRTEKGKNPTPEMEEKKKHTENGKDPTPEKEKEKHTENGKDPTQETEEKEKHTENGKDPTQETEEKEKHTENGKDPTQETEEKEKHTENGNDQTPEMEYKQKHTKSHADTTTERDKETDHTGISETPIGSTSVTPEEKLISSKKQDLNSSSGETRLPRRKSDGIGSCRNAGDILPDVETTQQIKRTPTSDALVTNKPEEKNIGAGTSSEDEEEQAQEQHDFDKDESRRKLDGRQNDHTDVQLRKIKKEANPTESKQNQTDSAKQSVTEDDFEKIVDGIHTMRIAEGESRKSPKRPPRPSLTQATSRDGRKCNKTDSANRQTTDIEGQRPNNYQNNLDILEEEKTETTGAEGKSRKPPIPPTRTSGKQTAGREKEKTETTGEDHPATPLRETPVPRKRHVKGSKSNAGPAKTNRVEVQILEKLGSSVYSSINIYLTFTEFMKWHFILRNMRRLESCTKKVSSLGFNVMVEEGQLLLEKTIDTADINEEGLKSVFLKNTENLKVSEWPLAGVECSALIDMLMATEIGKNGEIWAYEEKGRSVHFCHPEHLTELVEQKVHEALDILTKHKFITADSVFSIVFKKIKFSEKAKEYIADKTFSLLWTCASTDRKVTITYQGSDESMRKFETWWQSDFVSSVRKTTYKGAELLKDSRDPEQFLRIFLLLRCQKQKRLYTDVNKTDESISMFSEVPSDSETEINALKLCLQKEMKQKKVWIHFRETKEEVLSLCKLADPCITIRDAENHVCIEGCSLIVDLLSDCILETTCLLAEDFDSGSIENYVIMPVHLVGVQEFNEVLDNVEKSFEGDIIVVGRDHYTAERSEKCFPCTILQPEKYEQRKAYYYVRNILTVVVGNPVPCHQTTIVQPYFCSGLKESLDTSCVYEDGKLRVPIPAAEKTKLFRSVVESLLGKLQQIKFKGIHHIALIVTEIESWPNQKYMKQLLHSLMESTKDSPKLYNIVFHCRDDKTFAGCSSICEEMTGNGLRVGIDVPSKGLQANAIVCYTDRPEYRFSKTVDPADLTDECLTKIPEGILQTLRIRKCVCNTIPTEAQGLVQFFLQCINQANDSELVSLLVPAFQLEKFSYPAKAITKALFGALKRFEERPRDQRRSLREVIILALKREENLFKVLQQENDQWQQYLQCRKNSAVVAGISICAQSFSFVFSDQDSLIFLYDEQETENLKNNQLLKECGSVVTDKLQKAIIDKARNKPVPTPGGNIPVMLIVHTICSRSRDSVVDAVIDALKMVNLEDKCVSTCLAFDSNHPFLQFGPDLIKMILEAVYCVAKELTNLREVLVMIDSPHCAQLFDYFEEFCRQSISAHEITIQIHGPVHMRLEAKKVLAERFIPSPTAKAAQDTKPEDIRCTGEGIEDVTKKWTDAMKDTWPNTEKLVIVSNIPDGLRKLDLTSMLPVNPEMVHFSDGDKQALIVCGEKKDAEKLTGSTIHQLKFRHVFLQSLGQFRSFIPESEIKTLKTENIYQECKKKLEEVGIKISEKPYQVFGHTSYQLLCAQRILDYYNHLKWRAIDNIPELVIAYLKLNNQQLKGFRNNSIRDIKLTESAVQILVDTRQNVEEDMAAIQELVHKICGKEITTVPVSKTPNNKDINEICDEIEAEMSCKCVFYSEAKKYVLVYCNSYEDLHKVKHLLGTKTGAIKLTGQGRRRRTQVAAHDGINADEEQKQAELNSNHKRHELDVSLQKDGAVYNLFGKITVRVYHGNILNVGVQCIVNAANRQLKHGGGVARAIAKAAGYALEKECDDYIHEYGELPVGQACTSAPGKLGYKCVVHTVGPQWSDYYPHGESDIHSCEDDLKQAILSALYKAEESGCTSIAIPAVSSAIFGVPEDLCVCMYVRAVIEYAQKLSGKETELKEIHFVDMNQQIVTLIQREFQAVVNEENSSSYNHRKYIFTGNSHSSSTSRSRVPRHNLPDYRKNQTGATNTEQVELPKPLISDEGTKTYCFFLGNDEKEKITICNEDIFDVNSSAIVIIAEKGQIGFLGKVVCSMMPKSRQKSFEQTLDKTLREKNVGTAFSVHGFVSRYKHIITVVYPYSERKKGKTERVNILKKAYHSIFRLSTEKNIDTVVTTLFGIDDKKDEDVELCSQALLEGYLTYCKSKIESNVPTKLHVILAIMDSHACEVAKQVFYNFIQQKLMEPEKGTVSASKNQSNEQEDSEDQCIICLDRITDRKVLPCGHSFCTTCIEQQFGFKEVCPTCGKVLGVIRGNQPSGNMAVSTSSRPCAGFESYGHIRISYIFPGGRQDTSHPNPGKWYTSVTRIAYLPNNERGQKIAKMLKVAFERQLVFTIGISRTTGKEAITWNDIHHKTTIVPGAQFGYPDETYLDRVTDELSVKGVTEEDIEGMEDFF